ncbi:MAG TPA: DUF2490 domain-containing protein [Flavisolibacter sp.]|nr:DUF2490 domain-containing protein [Flavisolibacter sp.]
MTVRIAFLMIVFCTNALHIQAQQQHSGWLASFNTFSLNNKWSIHFDAQVRSTDELEHVQTLLLRPGVNYHINKKISVTAGYGFIDNRRNINGVTGYVTEHRTWQQLLFAHKWSVIQTSHRFRLEQRFLPVADINDNELHVTHHETANRLRYFIRNVVPLQNAGLFTKGFFFALQDELFLNTGNKKIVNGKTFDQNRLYAAIGYRLESKIDLEAGYMHQYSKTANNSLTNNILQLALYTRL